MSALAVNPVILPPVLLALGPILMVSYRCHPNVGGELPEYIGYNATVDLIKYVDDLYIGWRR